MDKAILFTPVLDAERLMLVERLAREIWYEYYVPLIGRAQVDYMMERFQTVSAMQAQLAEGYLYFLIEQREEGGGPALPVGYLAVQPQPQEQTLFLSKLYLLARTRGSGLGRRALDFVASLARRQGLQRVWLTVNKGNPARFAYERAGFVRVADIVMDIGGGFVMDDYRMEKILT